MTQIREPFLLSCHAALVPLLAGTFRYSAPWSKTTMAAKPICLTKEEQHQILRDSSFSSSSHLTSSGWLRSPGVKSAKYTVAK